MSKALDNMVQQLCLSPLSSDVFLGQSSDFLGNGRIFGGQVLGQALMASALTVDTDRQIHSLHAYFVRPGDVNKAIRYEVERVRDGGSFSHRRVVAYQDDQHIFTMASNYQIQEEGFEHHTPMPDLPNETNFPSENEVIRHIAHRLPPSLTQRHLFDGNPIEFRLAHPERILSGKAFDASTFVWFKTNGELDPQNKLLHQSSLAYASDFYMLLTSLFPHGQTCFDPHLQMASLDHAIWFHRPINMNEWNLFLVESPNASGARGLSFGKIYNPRGQLLATIAQEGLIRHPLRFESSK